MKRLLLLVIILALPGSAEEVRQEDLAIYEIGKANEAWAAIDRMILNPLAREKKQAEQALMAVLKNRDASLDARTAACRGLRLVGESDAVPVLLGLLRTERISSEARLAVERKSHPELNPISRQALATLPNRLKTGILATLAARRDSEAVEEIAKLASVLPDPEVQVAAIRALGQIGTVEAWKALAASRYEDGARRRALGFALLDCARHIVEERSTREQGLSALQKLANPANPRMIRIGALVELAKADPSQALTIARQAATNTDTVDALLSILPRLSPDEAGKLFGKDFASWPPKMKLALVGHWKPAFGQAELLRQLTLSSNVDPALREAALRAIDLANVEATP